MVVLFSFVAVMSESVCQSTPGLFSILALIFIGAAHLAYHGLQVSLYRSKPTACL